MALYSPLRKLNNSDAIDIQDFMFAGEGSGFFVPCPTHTKQVERGTRIVKISRGKRRTSDCQREILPRLEHKHFRE